MRTRFHQRWGAWLALFAVALYALWPLLATAQPRTPGGQYELCPHTWLHKFSEETHKEKPSSNPIWSDHQLKCAFSPGTGDGSSPLPDAAALLVIDGWQIEIAVPAVDTPPVPSPFNATAPRGPPLFS